MKWWNKELLVMAAVLGLAAHWTWGSDKAIEIGKVPAKIREALKAKWPKADIIRAATDEVDGRTVYGFELSEGSGRAARRWFASFNPDGKVRETQETLKPADLPKSILQVLQKRYPGVRAPKVEKITESEGKLAKVTYELKFAMQVNIDASGKIIEEKDLDFEEAEEE